MRGAVVVCLLLLGASRASAQAPLSVPPPAAQSFLTRSVFSFSWTRLVSGDPRFEWDAALGADLDVVDYRSGRLTFTADYEAVLGGERRAFDLNHGNYTLDSSATYRLHLVEVAAAFHHVSRHLSDRENAATIAWNAVDVRATRQFTVGRSTIDAQLEAGRVLQHTYVDYVWTSDLRLAIRRPLNQRAELFGRASGGLIGVDRARVGRDRQCGARLETGIRINGEVSGLELFAGYERRIDAYPLDRHRERWFAFGFRLVGR